MNFPINNLFEYAFRQVILGGGVFIIYFLAILCSYLFIRLIVLFFKNSTQFKELLFSFMILFAELFSITFVSGYIISYLSLRPTENDVISASIFLMNLDLEMFKVYPVFWLHDVTNIYYGVIKQSHVYFQYVYVGLGFIILSLLLLTIYKRPNYFYRFVISLLLTTILATPIWYLVPAVSPQELFFDGKFIFEISPNLKSYIDNFSPSVAMISQLEFYKAMWKSNVNGYFAITTFPSMHVGWTTVLFYYGSRFSKYLLIPLAIFYLSTCIATVYLLQHYAVDSLMGTIIGFLAITISETYFRKTPSQIMLINFYIHEDVKNLVSFSEIISKRIIKYLYSR